MIVGYDPGFHNQSDGTLRRLMSEGAYKDLSTIILIPALNTVAAKAANSWMNMIKPPNQSCPTLMILNMEVGNAYTSAIEMILGNPSLAKHKYILTIEADNTVPPDGLVKLLEKMEQHPEYACIGGLYYTKGHGGQPQIWGDPTDPVLNFRPQVPRPGHLQECTGTGMGFNLFRMDVFKDERLRKPWFKTTSSSSEGCQTQDLFFWSDARKHGYRCAIDTTILVGHVDMNSGFVW